MSLLRATNRFAISNLAWPAEADEQALALAAELGFSGLEVAPAKVFGSLDGASRTRAAAYRATVEAHGLRVVALQAVLFGVADVHLFRGLADRARLAARLTQAAEVASQLGATSVVFGAPGVRDPGALPPAEALEQARAFFGQVADVYAGLGVSLCLEANPAAYGCLFVTHTQQALELVRSVGKDGFDLQIDTGAIFINDEPDGVIETALGWAGHLHVSEPHLAAVGSSGVDHRRIGELASRSRYEGWMSVEMKATDDWRRAIETAARLLARDYGRSAGI